MGDEDDDEKKRKVKDDGDEGENEGEGSKSADAAYRKNVDEFLEREDPSKLGRQAAEELEREPEKFAEAEREGKKRVAEEDERDRELI